MTKYFHPETETDPECLTIDGEKRLIEIQAGYRRDIEKVESLFEDDGDAIAREYATIADPVNFWVAITSRMLDKYEEEALLKLREEENLGI